MLSKRRRSESNVAAWPYGGESIAPFQDMEGFIVALCSGGDSRMTIDPHTGLNKYLCPVLPASDLV
jgi:hypothetical protein